MKWIQAKSSDEVVTAPYEGGKETYESSEEEVAEGASGVVENESDESEGEEEEESEEHSDSDGVAVVKANKFSALNDDE